MKKMLLVGGKLAVICAVSAYVLAMVNAFTEPRINENRARALREALQSIAGEGRIGDEHQIPEEEQDVESPKVTGYYPIYGTGGDNVTGYILQLVGSGYGGEMNLIAKYDTGGTILGAVLMENQESPGLGKKAEDPGYMEKFIRTGGDEPVPVRKDQLSTDEADAVTGSTITFVGIAQALKEGSEFVRTLNES
jgi:Na+-translocating ferredoxin:NAD+ oxidoreductase subunit G